MLAATRTTASPIGPISVGPLLALSLLLRCDRRTLRSSSACLRRTWAEIPLARRAPRSELRCAPEVTVLSSTGVTRLQQSPPHIRMPYDPGRLPPVPPRLRGARPTDCTKAYEGQMSLAR